MITCVKFAINIIVNITMKHAQLTTHNNGDVPLGDTPRYKFLRNL